MLTSSSTSDILVKVSSGRFLKIGTLEHENNQYRTVTGSNNAKTTQNDSGMEICHKQGKYSSATLTEVFPCFFLSCNANARV